MASKAEEGVDATESEVKLASVDKEIGVFDFDLFDTFRITNTPEQLLLILGHCCSVFLFKTLLSSCTNEQKKIT